MTVSFIRYYSIDYRPVLPRGYEILTNGEDYKWKKYSPFFFYRYESMYTYETKEEAIDAVWRNSGKSKAGASVYRAIRVTK